MHDERSTGSARFRGGMNVPCAGWNAGAQIANNDYPQQLSFLNFFAPAFPTGQPTAKMDRVLLAESPADELWDKVVHFWTEGCPNRSPCAYYVAGGAYSILMLAAFFLYVRIHYRLPGTGWTLQKAFYLFNVFVCFVRALSLFFWGVLEHQHFDAALFVIFDIPSLMFFTTYLVLVLFWTEIVHGEQLGRMCCTPRVVFVVLNVVVYFTLGAFWILTVFHRTENLSRTLSAWFQFAINMIAGILFAVYGIALFVMLKRSPVHNKMRKQKMVEVMAVMLLGILCFFGKAAFELVSHLNKQGLEEGDDLMMNFLFWGLTEILVIATALGLLGGIPEPPKRPEPYEPVSIHEPLIEGDP